MMKQLVAATILLWAANGGAMAAAFCNCCESALSASCETACAAVAVPGGQCPVAVDFSGMEDIGPGRNPFYTLPFNTLRLDKPAREEREVFRRLLERARNGVERDRRAALKDHAAGRIDAETAARLAKRYDDAMVNYYLGQQAYRSSGQTAKPQ